MTRWQHWPDIRCMANQGGQIYFPLEVFFNLKPLLTTFLNSPRNSCEYLYKFFKLKMVPNWIFRCQEEDDPRKNLKLYCYTVSLSLYYTHCLGIALWPFDPLMCAKLKSKTHLLNMFFDFFEPFFAHLSWKFEKILVWPKKFFFKNQNRC